jgi:streptomycin 6-kinase
MTGSRIPHLDDELRRRLGRRYGRAIEPWLRELPVILSDLSERWQVELESLIQRGSMSVVILCRAADGRPAVLKVSPDRMRLAGEAAALARWHTVHVPVVLAVDESVGALLIEAIEPGTALAEAAVYPSMEDMVALIASLHAEPPDCSYRPVQDHITYLFDSGEKVYHRKPELVDLISPELYERGRQLALQLAGDSPAPVLLHGDLTAANVLDGGKQRGLVAIDPAPCLGDPAFDAIDLLFWRAESVEMIAARAEQLAPAVGTDPERLLEWCSAFAGMVALEMAEAPDAFPMRLEPFVALASLARQA